MACYLMGSKPSGKIGRVDAVDRNRPADSAIAKIGRVKIGRIGGRRRAHDGRRVNVMIGRAIVRPGNLDTHV